MQNITDQLYAGERQHRYGTSFDAIYKGSLYRISTAADYGFSGGDSLMADYVVGLDASKSSTVYKNNCSAVRVKSYGVYMWRRIR